MPAKKKEYRKDKNILRIFLKTPAKVTDKPIKILLAYLNIKRIQFTVEGHDLV